MYYTFTNKKKQRRKKERVIKFINIYKRFFGKTDNCDDDTVLYKTDYQIHIFSVCAF